MGRHGTIAGRKAAQDSKRAAMFTKYGRAITVAAKAGGDPAYNATLRVAIEKAKGISMPNDSITRAIKKGTGELEGETYEELSFEGYGAGGVAVIVDALTDNKNRTTSAVRSTFDKFGGNLGTPGCVSYMFSRKGIILIEKTDSVDEDALMEAALEAGADDMITNDDSFEIQTDPAAYTDVHGALIEAGYEILESDIEYVPSMENAPTEEHDIKKLAKMIDILEDNDDVQKVYTNCSIDLSEVDY
ncbi:MAG: YebC/PmpR family DNA-binding transcriptional regulator [Clostridia bacterium]|nr:YebC/PmpR family DNA-binding transcriptional regulator [Clostridia bacterium]